MREPHIPFNELLAKYQEMYKQQMDRENYARIVPTSDGLPVPYGPRPVTMSFFESTTEVSHSFVLRLLSRLLDQHAAGAPTSEDTVLIVAAAYALVISDLETGTSIATWPVMNDLVDRALGLVLQTPVTTTWKEF